jgi:polyvinyl alcohol dehydrogenase (cytochrome)
MRTQIPTITLFLISQPALFTQDSASLYERFCASCHESEGVQRAPNRRALSEMSAERILASMESGSMFNYARPLASNQRDAVAEYLSGKKFHSGKTEDEPVKSAFCRGAPGAFDNPFSTLYWNGWERTPENHRYQPSAIARLAIADLPNLKLKWAFGFPGDIRAYSQPTIIGGRLFVGSAAGRVYSLDAKTGCIFWSFRAASFVRSTVIVASLGDRYAAIFGDGRANVYALDAAHGGLLWKTTVDDHPARRITGGITIHNHRVYVPVASGEESSAIDPLYQCCTFRGSVVALELASGRHLWKSFVIPDEPRPTKKQRRGVQQYGPSGAGIWSSPTVDLKRNVLYVTTGNSYSDSAAPQSNAFVALSLDTGRLAWWKVFIGGDAFNGACVPLRDNTNCPEAQGPDFDFAASAILADLPEERRALIAGQKSGWIYAVDPDRNGELLWQRRIARGGLAGGIQWGAAADQNHVYVAIADTDDRRRLMPGGVSVRELNPFAGGGLFALALSTGATKWQADPIACDDRRPCSPGQSAAVSIAGDIVFSGSISGHLRAYSVATGEVVWTYDTYRPFETVNGVKARGGAIDGPGPVIVDGMVYTNSGYGLYGGQSGNVLLAFRRCGKASRFTEKQWRSET